MSAKKENNHVSSDNYIVIQGWMCNELELKGNDLLVYALINGFTQDGKSKYYGGRQYIANTFNISLPTVDKALQNLLNMNLIIKEPCKTQADTDIYYINISGKESKIADKQRNKETLLGDKQPNKETLPNNKDILKKEIDNFTNVKLEQPTVTPEQPKRRVRLVDTPKDIQDTDSVNKSARKKSLYEKCAEYIDTYTQDNKLHGMLIEYLKFRLAVKDKPIYFPQWRSMVNTLDELASDVNTKYKIVQQSLNSGYLKFFELRSFSNYSKNRNFQDPSVFSEYGQVKSEKRANEVIMNVEF